MTRFSIILLQSGQKLAKGLNQFISISMMARVVCWQLNSYARIQQREEFQTFRCLNLAWGQNKYILFMDTVVLQLVRSSSWPWQGVEGCCFLQTSVCFVTQVTKTLNFVDFVRYNEPSVGTAELCLLYLVLIFQITSYVICLMWNTCPNPNSKSLKLTHNQNKIDTYTT